MNKLIKIMLLLVLAAFCSLASAQEPDYADTGNLIMRTRAAGRTGVLAKASRPIYLLYAPPLTLARAAIKI